DRGKHERLYRSRDRPHLAALLLRRRAAPGRRNRRAAHRRGAAAARARRGRRCRAPGGRDRAGVPGREGTRRDREGSPCAGRPPGGLGPHSPRIAIPPLVTLLTDFGTTDAYVAELKGVLLS